MPQMKPILWLSVFTMNVLCLMCIMSALYFMAPPAPTIKSNKTFNKKKTMLSHSLKW